MADKPFTIAVTYILGIIYGLLFIYSLVRYAIHISFKIKYRINYVRNFSVESKLAKVFYICLCIQILLDTVFFFLLPMNAKSQIYS